MNVRHLARRSHVLLKLSNSDFDETKLKYLMKVEGHLKLLIKKPMKHSIGQNEYIYIGISQIYENKQFITYRL